MIYTATFGVNDYKTKDSEFTAEEIIKAAVENAREAAKGTDVKIALDIGPCGRMLEPNGNLPFEEAYELFKGQVTYGKGADLIVIETMTDLYEMKAALLAAKENSNLPVICTMTFEENKRTFTGTCISSMALTLEALGADAGDRLTLADGTVLLDGAPFTGTVIYTGAVDELFGCRYGRLPYRTLNFRFETHPVDFWQSHGTVNYTVDQDYTRITEFKYLTGQELPGVTTIMKEYSAAYTGGEGEVPYYAIINEANNALYARYKAEADRYPRFHLLGRLAEYKYYNMDAIAARALALCDDLLK